MITVMFLALRILAAFLLFAFLGYAFYALSQDLRSVFPRRNRVLSPEKQKS